MKDFLRHNGIWVLVAALVLSVAVGVSSVALGGQSGPLSNLVGTITAPVRSGVTWVAERLDSARGFLFHYGELEEQVSQLEQEVARLEEQLRQSEAALVENDQLRELLNLQAKRRDFVFESARITGRSTDNWRSTLTLSKGSESGIQEGNCVITETGVLVGVVSTVGDHFATVTTMIDASMEMGGLITRTNTAGVLEGEFSLMKEGKLRLSYLSDDAQLVAGDEVVTSGKGNVYPSGLVVGTVEAVFDEPSGMTRYGVVVPSAALDQLVNVFVIKDFDIVE